MNFLPLLNQRLKSSSVIDLLETADAEVVYHFDRLNENALDRYTAVFFEDGFELQFDQDQRLKVIFIYAASSEGIKPADLSDSDILRFQSIADVEHWAASKGFATQRGQAELLGVVRDWVKVVQDTHTLHYEFRNGGLGLITITAS